MAHMGLLLNGYIWICIIFRYSLSFPTNPPSLCLHIGSDFFFFGKHIGSVLDAELMDKALTLTPSNSFISADPHCPRARASDQHLREGSVLFLSN